MTARDLANRLNEILEEEGQTPLSPETALGFGQYGELLVRWNARMNLTAIRDEELMVRRHFAECIRAARSLPSEVDTLLDFGSGAGFPGVPIALCRPEIAVTLAESQTKKAMFLREAVRVLGLKAGVHAGRADDLAVRFECVTLRAVDKMEEAVPAAAALVREGGWLALLTTKIDAGTWQKAAGFLWDKDIPIGGDDRVLALGRKP